MRGCFKMFIVPFLVVFLCAGGALATNITIYDENGYEGIGQGGEDQETEPGMVNSQIWDLEAFFLFENDLTMVGGFDFENGVSSGLNNPDKFVSGDIFISTLEDKPLFGSAATAEARDTGNDKVLNTFGYNYVIDLDFSTSTYNVYHINDSTWVWDSYYSGYTSNQISNQASDPWNFNITDNQNMEGYAKLLTSGAIGYRTFTGDALGFYGDSYSDNHYTVDVALDFLEADTDFYAHFTMQCGNDNLMGHGTTAPVPEPATLLLLGTGLVGLAGVSRRKIKKA